MKSIKLNYLYNIANTFLGLIFPLITFPYVSRVLQPDGIGLYNFYSSIIAYVGLFANLGIPLYAIRKVAQHRDDQTMLSKLTVEIFILNLITTLVAYTSVFILDAFVPRIYENRALFYVISIGVIVGPLSVNWFFQAMEDFKYITIRSLFIKFLSFILLLTLVNEKDDLMTYAVICLLASAGNYIFNIVHIGKYIQLRDIRFKTISIYQHLKPSLVLFVLNIVISIYINLDSIMLGFIQNDEAVGYYAVPVRVSHVILSLVTSFGVVLLPRFSYLLESGRINEFNQLCRKSMDYTIGLSLPIVLGLIILSAPLIYTLFGAEYQNSILVLQLISPIILLAGITNVLGIQILYPKGKELLVVYSTLGAAIVNLFLNVILIPHFSYNGAAFSTFVAECIVLVLQIRLGRSYLPSRIFTRSIIDYILASVVMAAVVIIIRYTCNLVLIQLVLGILVGTMVYYGVLLSRHNDLALNIRRSILNKINH